MEGLSAMKKLVTGATGFMGSSIVRELLKDGEEVKVLVRKTSDTSNIDGLEVEKAYGDIRDGDSIKNALKGCDTLYYTAAFFSHWTPDKKLPYEVNVDGTKASMKAALDSGVERVVYTSTNNTLGAHGPIPVDESAEFNHWKTGDHYSMSKYLAEIEAKKMGIKVLLADISSENRDSIKFHLKNGFSRCGLFHKAGFKFGKHFDVVWMEKELG